MNVNEEANRLAHENGLGEVLVVTLSGSRLLGTQGAESDWDYYCVAYPGEKAVLGLENTGARAVHLVQTAHGVDLTVATFGHLYKQVLKGGVNATNALFAPTLSGGFLRRNLVKNHYLLKMCRLLVNQRVVHALLAWAGAQRDGTPKERRRSAALVEVAWGYATNGYPEFPVVGLKRTEKEVLEALRSTPLPAEAPERTQKQVLEEWRTHLLHYYK